MDLYLAFDHTETHDSYTYYYFRVGLFPSGLVEDVLILLSDLEQTALFDLPPYVPSSLPSGTETAYLSGSPYTVPEDLYLLYIGVNPFSPTNTPIYDFLNDAISPQAIAVYTTELGTPSRFPDGYDPDTDKPPNVTGASGWYVPTLATKNITVASRRSSTPFWTNGVFEFFPAYGSGEYTCEGLPYNIHITCNPGEMTSWEAPTNYLDYGSFRVDGYYRNIQSNESTYLGFSLVYNSGSPLSSLDGQAYGTSDSDDPVVYWPHLDFSDSLPCMSPDLLTLPALELINLLDINSPFLLGSPMPIFSEISYLSAKRKARGVASNSKGVASNSKGVTNTR